MTISTSSVPAAAVAVFLAVALPGCGGSSPQAAEPAEVERTRLSVATAFAPFSVPLADEYRRQMPELDVQTQRALGSAEVIAGLEDGSIDLGIGMADMVYSTYWSHPQASDGASAIRGVALLQPLPQYLLVRGHSGIRGVADLEGRTLLVGPPSTTSYLLAPLILEAFGVTSEVTPVNTRAEATKLLVSGAADAALLPGYVYPDDELHPAIEAGAYFVPIDGPAVDRLRLSRPFLRRAMIPRGIYFGQDRIIPTIGIDMVVVCRRDLDASLVYRLTSALMNAYPTLSGVEANLRFLNPDEASATPIPLHAGAARYFREREISR